MNKILLILLFIIATSQVALSEQYSITFSWDAVDVSDGYRLYYGKKSRHDESLDAAAITKNLYEKHCGIGDRVDCIESWKNYCKDDEDKLCDKDFFLYDNEIDVGDSIEHTVQGLDSNYEYFFAVTNYENEGEISIISTGQRESKYSLELYSQTSKPKDEEPPDMPKGFKKK